MPSCRRYCSARAPARPEGRACLRRAERHMRRATTGGVARHPGRAATRQGVITFQTGQRIHAEPECISSRIDLGAAVVDRHGHSRRGVGRNHLADLTSRRRVADKTEGFRRATRNQRNRIGHRCPQRLDSRGIADQSQSEGRHLTHFLIGVGLQQPDERRHTLGQSHAADGNRRTAPDARFAIAQQENEIGWRRWWRNRNAACLRHRCRQNGCARVAQNPLIFETDDP